MTPTKKLLTAFSEINFPAYVIEQLSDNPHLMSTGLKRMCKPPHIKEGMNPKDTKTKYGLLYTSFNNVKTKLGLNNYDDRYEFIDRWMSDKKFVKLFKAYKKSGFNRTLRPSLIIVNTVAEFPFMEGNVEWITYDENVRSHNMVNAKQVTEMRGGKPRKVYESIRKAANETSVHINSVRYHLKQKAGAYRYTTQAHIDHIEETKARVKQDKKKRGVEL